MVQNGFTSFIDVKEVGESKHIANAEDFLGEKSFLFNNSIKVALNNISVFLIERLVTVSTDIVHQLPLGLESTFVFSDQLSGGDFIVEVVCNDFVGFKLLNEHFSW